MIQGGDSNRFGQKKMSISGDLDTGTLVADKVLDQFGTVKSLRQLDDEAFVKGRSSVMRTQSEEVMST